LLGPLLLRLLLACRLLLRPLLLLLLLTRRLLRLLLLLQLTCRLLPTLAFLLLGFLLFLLRALLLLRLSLRILLLQPCGGHSLPRPALLLRGFGRCGRCALRCRRRLARYGRLTLSATCGVGSLWCGLRLRRGRHDPHAALCRPLAGGVRRGGGIRIERTTRLLGEDRRTRLER